jgi:hypothetical protein
MSVPSDIEEAAKKRVDWHSKRENMVVTPTLSSFA